MIKHLRLRLGVTEYQIQLIMHVVSQQHVNKLLFVLIFQKMKLLNCQKPFHTRIFQRVQYPQLRAQLMDWCGQE